MAYVYWTLLIALLAYLVYIYLPAIKFALGLAAWMIVVVIYSVLAAMFGERRI